MHSPLFFRACKSALSLGDARLGSIIVLPAVGRSCPRRGSDAAAAVRRRSTTAARVAGIQDIPTSSTPLPPLAANPAPAQQDDGFVAPAPEDWANHDLLMAGCEPGKRLNVAVLLSGGVDSSLALRLLRAAGHSCRAFYLQIWFQEDFRNFWDACPWEEDLQYARQVCESLGVPLEVVPLTTEYWDRVVSSSVEEIRAGRTPNPDMWCNSRVKFGAFYDYLDRTHGPAFDRVASGHYARVERVPRQRRAPLPPEQQQQQETERQETERQETCGGTGVEDSSSSGRGSSSGFGRGSEEVEVEAERRASHAAASTSGPASAAWGRQQQAPGAAPTHGSVPVGYTADAGARRAAAGGGAAGGAGGGEADTAVDEEEGEEVRLLLTPDAVKDQTYFLANLSPRQLSRVMFPLGCLTKSQVRKLAAAADLANKNRKDSQGICFLGKVKFHEFVREHLGEWPGPILEAESGQPLGLHAGYWFYTVGQRGGIKLPGGPWYVVAKDTLRNAVLVSRQYYDPDKQRNTFTCGPFNWLDAAARPASTDPRIGEPLYVKVRHGPNMYQCQLRLHDAAGDDTYGADSYGTVVLEQNDQGLAAGQYAVFYQGGRCLGCAVIQSTVDAPSVAAAGGDALAGSS